MTDRRAKTDGRARALGLAGITALVAACAALGALSSPAPTAPPTRSGQTADAASQGLSSALRAAPVAAIEVAEGAAVAVPWVDAWRPAERASREVAAQAPRPVAVTTPGAARNAPWRTPGHLRVGGDGAGDEGPG